MLTLNIEIARRFILGKQGLWPGRRWHGSAGTEQAMRAMNLHDVAGPAYPCAVISAPNPGVVNKRVVAVDHQADRGFARSGAAHPEEDIAQHRGVGRMVGAAAAGADLKQNGCVDKPCIRAISLPLMCIRRRGAACETPHFTQPPAVETEKPSAPRQKF